MFFEIVLLTIVTIIALLLFLLYKKLSKLLNFVKEGYKFVKDEFSYSDFSHFHDGFYEQKRSMKDWLPEFRDKLYEIQNNTQNVNYALNYEFPIGDDSARSKRHKSLISIYSNKLTEKLNLSEKEATARSAFELTAFDSDRLIYRLENEHWGLGENSFEKEDVFRHNYLTTGLLSKDCNARIPKLSPTDIFFPIWVLFNKYREYDKSFCVKNSKFSINNHPKDYDEYIKDRSIVMKLLNLEIIGRCIPKRKNEDELLGDFWLDRPYVVFRIDNINEIYSIIFQGQKFQDDYYYERKYDEDQKTTHFFELALLQ